MKAVRLLAVFTVILLGVLFACATHIDPDTARFSCTTSSDCGSGYSCIPQAKGPPGRCYKNGECTTEVCDGKDNDCDGVVDNGFDLTNDNANCGACGHVCGVGAACVSSGCVETNCSNGLDDDGNGATDCADLACLGLGCSVADGGLNCGRVVPDGGSPDAGATLGACVPRETACGDGLDNDGDGTVDCADSDCLGQPCDLDGGVCNAGHCS